MSTRMHARQAFFKTRSRSDPFARSLSEPFARSLSDPLPDVARWFCVFFVAWFSPPGKVRGCPQAQGVSAVFLWRPALHVQVSWPLPWRPPQRAGHRLAEGGPAPLCKQLAKRRQTRRCSAKSKNWWRRPTPQAKWGEGAPLCWARRAQGRPNSSRTGRHFPVGKGTQQRNTERSRQRVHSGVGKQDRESPLPLGAQCSSFNMQNS